MPHRSVLMLLLVPVLLLAGCGTKSGTANVASHRGTPPVLAKAGAAPRVLRPDRTETTLGRKNLFRLQASLTGHGRDTITIRVLPGFDGQVTVTSGRTVIFQQQHVSGASVIDFGRRHLPLLLLQGSLMLCGSGGCTNTAYTWSATRHRMLPVPAPGIAAYQYAPKRRQFLATTVPETGGLFGYVVPGRLGIVLHGRTYDVWQHGLAVSYAYAPGLSGTGGWVAVGRTSYGPSGHMGGSPFTSPGQALLALLEARGLGFRSQVAEVAESPADEVSIWRDLSPIGSWQGSLVAIDPSPKITTSDALAIVSDRISGLVGTGAAASLHIDEVTAILRRVGTAYVVRSAHLAPIAVKVPTAMGVLSIIRADRALLRVLAKSGNPPLLVEAIGQQWQVSMARRGGHDAPWIDIEAQNGSMHKPG